VQSFDLTRVVGLMVTEDVAKLVQENVVNNSEIAAIDAVIERMRFHTKPFPMMERFNAEAFTGLSKTQIREIHNCPRPRFEIREIHNCPRPRFAVQDPDSRNTWSLTCTCPRTRRRIGDFTGVLFFHYVTRKEAWPF